MHVPRSLRRYRQRGPGLESAARDRRVAVRSAWSYVCSFPRWSTQFYLPGIETAARLLHKLARTRSSARVVPLSTIEWTTRRPPCGVLLRSRLTYYGEVVAMPHPALHRFLIAALALGAVG